MKQYSTLLCGDEVPVVGPVRLCVGPDLVVGDDVDDVSDACEAGGVVADTVALNGRHPRLVEGDPLLDLLGGHDLLVLMLVRRLHDITLNG